MNENQTNHTIRIDLWKAVAIIAGTILTTMVGTAFGVANTGISNHYTLVRAVDDISELKEKTVSRSEFEPAIQTLTTEVRDIKKSQQETQNDVSTIKGILQR